MKIEFTLPIEPQELGKDAPQDICQAAKEALLAQLCRQGVVTPGRIGRLLGIGPFGTDSLLRRHSVFQDEQNYTP